MRSVSTYLHPSLVSPRSLQLDGGNGVSRTAAAVPLALSNATPVLLAAFAGGYTQSEAQERMCLVPVSLLHQCQICAGVPDWQLCSLAPHDRGMLHLRKDYSMWVDELPTLWYGKGTEICSNGSHTERTLRGRPGSTSCSGTIKICTSSKATLLNSTEFQILVGRRRPAYCVEVPGTASVQNDASLYKQTHVSRLAM